MRQLNKYQSAYVSTPTEAQCEFLERCEVPGSEVMFGYGAMSGGSTAVMLAALEMLDVPNSQSLILSHRFIDMARYGSMMHQFSERSAPMMASIGRYAWKSENGAIIEFGYCDEPNGKYKFAGLELNFIGFDHLERFGESDYLFLKSRSRGNWRIASNANFSDHKKSRWIQRYFADKLVKSSAGINPYIDLDEHRRSISLIQSLSVADRYRLEFGEEPPTEKECREAFSEWKESQ